MSFELPDLASVHDDDGSHLARKFGPGLTNYFSGSPLNRLSFLRGDGAFLGQAFASPAARFVVLNDFAPLVRSVSELRCLGVDDVLPVTGPDPLGGGRGQTEDELVKSYDSSEGPRPLVVFLGLWEEEEDAVGNGKGPPAFQYKTFKGRPWFSVDVTPRGSYAAAAQALIDRVATKEESETAGDGSFFLKATRQNSLKAINAAIYGQARGMTDWNTRNQYCASCGLPTMSVQAGYKRTCPPTDLSGTTPPTTAAAATTATTSGDTTTIPRTPQPRRPCPSRTGGVSNISFPRSDPTMIAAVLSADGRRLLLGRNRRWRRTSRFFSVLAGFLEPGESVEEAVRREVWEESGVRVGRVVLHSTQPWPYPASLMIGAVAAALPGPGNEDIHTGHDDELEEAKWVGLDEVREALKRPVVNLGDEKPDDDLATGGEELLLLPPHTAIANRLLAAVVDGFATVDEARI